MNIIFVILGLFLAAMGLWGVISTLRCRLPIDAVCVDSVAISSQGMKTYAAVFAYTHEGQQYRQSSFQSFPRQRLRSRFRLDETYRVYIDPQNPSCVAVDRTPQMTQWMLMVLGVVMIAVGLR
ncbi:MAG: DUF3592 domain-containing protein [Oscillospiraceae bacterium]|nr:DUF3592 domain-containing protein [Oscillospiraceae bacterium]